MKNTVKGFIDFIHDQHDDKAINHDDWESCAVGEYVRNAGIGAPEFANNDLYHEYKNLSHLLNLRGYGTFLPRGVWYDYTVLGDQINTYGKLKTWIKNNPMPE